MLIIDTLKPKDLETTAELHEENLKLGLFPRLGKGFLQKYQASFLESPHGIALVAREEGRIAGVLFGTSSNGAHYRWVMRNHGHSLAASGCAALLLRPSLTAEFIRTRAVRYMRGFRNHMRREPDAVSAEASAPAPAVSVLSHIVTDPTVRKAGVGRKLVARFRAIARSEGAGRALLVTEEGGMGAGFFERIGCALVARREGQDGTTVREYRLPLYGEARNEIVTARSRDRALAGAFRPGLRPVAARSAAPQPVHGIDAR